MGEELGARERTLAERTERVKDRLRASGDWTVTDAVLNAAERQGMSWEAVRRAASDRGVPDFTCPALRRWIEMTQRGDDDTLPSTLQAIRADLARLCRAAEEVSDVAEEERSAAWFRRAVEVSETAAVRQILESLARSGSADVEALLAAGSEAGRTPWDCQALRALWGPT